MASLMFMNWPGATREQYNAVKDIAQWDKREPEGVKLHLVGFDDDDLVAYACFGATPGTDRTFDLYWIAVHPTAQRHGDGSRLLAEVEQRLRDRGARLIVVETSSRPEFEKPALDAIRNLLCIQRKLQQIVGKPPFDWNDTDSRVRTQLIKAPRC